MLRIERVKKLMDDQGRTRKWMAAKCGISVGHFNHILRGHRPMSTASLILLAQALETSVNFLLDKEPPTKNKKTRPKLAHPLE